MKKVSALIANYNTKDTLRECLLNLTNNNYENLEIIIYDNCSTDGAPQMVKDEFPQVVLIEGKDNKGISHSYNRAFEVSTGDFILYIGSDSFPKKHDILGLIEYLEQNKDVGLVTAKLVTRDGKLDLDAHRGFPTPWVAFTHFSKLNKLFKKSPVFNSYFKEHENFDTVHEIDACISHFMFVPRFVVEQIQGWDESFFVFGEDIDFCYRIKQNNYKIMYNPNFEVLHYKGASIGTRKSTAKLSKASLETKTKMIKASTDAMRIFYKKHYTHKYPILITELILGAISVLTLVRLIKLKLKR